MCIEQVALDWMCVYALYTKHTVVKKKIFLMNEKPEVKIYMKNN